MDCIIMVAVVGVIPAAAMASAMRLCLAADIPLLVCLVVNPELASLVACIAQTIKTSVFSCKSKGRQRKYVKLAPYSFVDVDVDKSFGLRCGGFRWNTVRAHWSHHLHPKFICHGPASWEDGSEIDGS